ncbi:MAG: hypothetical protein OXM61_24580 [Candidatus Poribacteria bacterium]|nr:hypothetical protein [Candidatus Poribacteria bacterium]
MEHLKQQRWYQVMVYSLIILIIGSFLLVSSIKILNATQTEMDCAELPKLDCILKKQESRCPKLTLPSRTCEDRKIKEN